jgi:hypothetical protein
MFKTNATKVAFIAVPISVVLITATSFIATAMISGQSSTNFGNTNNSPEPTFSLLTTSSPTPNQQQSSDATTEPESNQPGSSGGNNNRPGGQNVPYMPGWTEAQRACQEQMSIMAAESNRLGSAHNNASNYAVALSAEMTNKYPGIPSNQWAQEDASRMDAAWAESERTSQELTAFWAQYPWNQWGCNENGLWHVP